MSNMRGSSTGVPIIDLSLLTQDSESKARVIKDIGKACHDFGCFSLINHGISGSLIQDALDANSTFFDVPVEEKMEIMSNDIYKPVRFGIVNERGGSGEFQREFLKLYAYPLEDWIELWPNNPSDYREKMGRYTMEMRRLSIQLIEAIMKSLHLNAPHWKDKIEPGMHMMAINLYQTSFQCSSLAGIPPHTDHSIITILLQSSPGLEFMNSVDGTWKSVPNPEGSLQVLVGDHLELLSNGVYKSILHRAIPSSEKSRLSVVSLHSFAMDEIVEPAWELVDEKNPKQYKGSSLRHFLKHLSSKQSESYIENLKIIS